MEKLIEKRGNFDGVVINGEKHFSTELVNDIICIKLFSSLDLETNTKKNYNLSVSLRDTHENIIYDKTLDTISKDYAIALALEYTDIIIKEKFKLFLNLSEELCRCKYPYFKNDNDFIEKDKLEEWRKSYANN